MISPFGPIVNNISWHFIYRIARLGLAFFITAWMARYLGPERYGIYIYSIALAELVMLFWSQGLKEVVIQQIKERGLEKSEVSIASFQLMVIGNTLLYGVLAAIVFLFNFDELIKILALICGIGIWFRCFESFELWFHSSLKIRVTVIVQFISQLIYMISNVFLIIYSADIFWFSVTYTGQLIFSGIGFLIVFPKRKNLKLFKTFKSLQLDLLRVGGVMMLAKLSYLTSFLIDRFLIENYLGVEALGIYVASMKLTITWIFISTAISYSFIPILTESKTEYEFSLALIKMFRYICYISIFITVLIYILSDYVVITVFGSGYADSSTVLKILIFSLPFVFVNEGIKSWLVVAKKTKFFMYSMLLTTLLSVILNVYFLPYFGIEGAAISFLFSWALGGFLIFSIFKETRSMFKHIIKSVFIPLKLYRNT
ncbi:MAG: flippase [Balneola sp.]